MGQGDLPFDSHIRWRLDFRKCFRLVVGKGMSSRGRGGIVNPGGRHAKSRGKRACERVADAFAGPSQSQTTTLCQARSPTTTPLLSSPLLSSLAYLSPSSSPLIPCVVLSTRAAPSNNQKRRRTRRRAASTRLISLFPLLSLQIGGWVAGVHRMDPIFQRAFSDPLYLEENVVQQGIERCPFLRNINEPTSFSLSSVSFPVPARGAKGPIFEDGPNFDMAFRVFHGRDGVVPLSEGSFPQIEKPLPKPNSEFNPLAAKAATISLSAFGGFFSFGDFSNKRNKKNSNKKNPNNFPQNGGQSNNHEALSNEWLEMGQCPLAKSYRALSGVVPLVAKMMTPPAGMKLRCPPAVVAARAALSRTAFAKGLRPQPLPTKILVIALLGMAANVPLGIWREHTEKFSVQWFAAVHAAVPFIGILRKSVLMPKTAMALTIAASILGQTIGSRAERIRLKRAAAKLAAEGHGDTATRIKAPMSLKTGSCSVVQLWDPLALKIESTVSPVLVPAVGAFD